MRELTRGQKGKLADLGGGDAFEVALDFMPQAGQTVDVSCFGLDAAGKLSDDRYFVFYNQKSSPEGAVEMRGDRFALQLDRLPASIHRLVFTATIDGNGTMGDLLGSHVDLAAGGSVVGRYSFSGSDFGGEKALMTFEIYRKDGWRFAAVGQGFAGGLSALLKHFGGEETGPKGSSLSPPAPATVPLAPAPPPPPAAVPAAPKVNLGKLTLDKKGAKGVVNLEKGGGHQPVLVNLNWDNPNAGKRVGMFGLGGKAPAPDLDLGCMYRLADGTKGVIQSLGNSFGSRHAAPHIFLDKDDRTGAAKDGENLQILRPDLIDMVTIFAMIYEGAANFATVNARLTIRNGAQEIFIPLNNPNPKLTFCTICVIRKAGNTVEITKEERYVTDHSQADDHYGFGFRWVAGSK